MARVVSEKLDRDAGEWIAALISLSKDERKCTLKDFCKECGIQYRFLYLVIQGKSAISKQVLDTLKNRAKRLGINDIIASKVLAKRLGITP